jgi:hypothetical protein
MALAFLVGLVALAHGAWIELLYLVLAHAGFASSC